MDTQIIKLVGHTLLYKNGVALGEILADVDGFYYFWPKLHGGHWDQTVLRAISDLLVEKNRPWQEQIERDMNSGEAPETPV